MGVCECASVSEYKNHLDDTAEIKAKSLAVTSVSRAAIYTRSDRDHLRSPWGDLALTVWRREEYGIKTAYFRPTSGAKDRA